MEAYYPDETHEYKGVYITIHTDEFPLNPRKEYGNAATMACQYGNYDLGDGTLELLYDALIEDPMFESCYEGHPDSKRYINPNSPSDCIEAAQRFGFEVLPLYLYDHSGLTISTSSFSCPWDSGMVGVIFMSKQDMRDNFNVKKVTKFIREKARDLMKAEVEDYDYYLTGQCYGYSIYKDKDSLDEIESCYGFIGDLEYVTWSAKNAADGIVDHFNRMKQKKVKQYIQNKVPLLKRVGE